jgi:23S rRNA (cytidine1920-2'-O)/16S rRNA (cytidine1409-2'-O)-methyltransferase
MVTRQRLDAALVGRGLAATREKAQALILAGEVSVNGQKALKPGQTVDREARLEVRESLRYVSRGGLKLEAALDSFHIAVEGKVCADIGTSTGGFTDCLLQRGAARVHCVDTGAGQIDWKLRTDARVVLHERTNARYLKPEDLGELVELIVCDVSFISVTLLIPALSALLRPGADCVVLVKPQFEVGRGRVGKGGIVREPELHREASRRVEAALGEHGFSTELMPSPILGAEGNREFLVHGWRDSSQPA